MRTKLANRNHYPVPLLSRAAVNFSWYDSTNYFSKDKFCFRLIADVNGQFFHINKGVRRRDKIKVTDEKRKHDYVRIL